VTNDSEPSVAVIGPGAIGTTIAAALHEKGRTITVVGRSVQAELRLDTDRETVIVPGPVVTDPARVKGPADIVFLAVKATQVTAAAAFLEALCGPATVLCVLQNGIEQHETVTPLVTPGSDVVPTIVWFPAQRHADGRVELRGDARLTVPDLPGGHSIQRILEGTLCTVEVSDDFATLAWRKLLQNAVAGLMALTGRRSAMFHRDDIAELATAYMQECLAIARADGASLGDDEASRLLDKFRAFPGDMSTSILTDREAGRPLEWDARNGVVQRRGRLLGLPTPISDVVVPLLAATSDGPG
jgi:2-dehydropantoate 2-reductase